ncbi:probable endochitinase [Aedes aegypti]|uniref:Chitin-binding type-2 domain-containing protein n=1 Tax=Aedes aegypti TaxID=7159 RepID=A0A6I8TWR0_AEDAE|nr:probable endochitinase [Aedes aegypti]
MNHGKAALCLLLVLFGLSSVISQSQVCVGNVGVHSFPDPVVCNAYIVCVDETSIPMTCNEGLIFDLNILKCNYPDISVCLPNLSASTTTTQSTPTVVPTPSTLAPTRPGEEPICPDRGLYFYPHISDCQRYYKCFYGKLYVLSCPFSLFWNQDIQFCDFKWNVACRNN